MHLPSITWRLGCFWTMDLVNTCWSRVQKYDYWIFLKTNLENCHLQQIKGSVFLCPLCSWVPLCFTMAIFTVTHLAASRLWMEKCSQLMAGSNCLCWSVDDCFSPTCMLLHHRGYLSWLRYLYRNMQTVLALLRAFYFSSKDLTSCLILNWCHQFSERLGYSPIYSIWSFFFRALYIHSNWKSYVNWETSAHAYHRSCA